MVRKFERPIAHLALAALVTFTGVSMSVRPADAVIYCKTVGAPKGCIVRPIVRPPVIYCKTRGVPKGCIMR
jgi:hypothetical protein